MFNVRSSIPSSRPRRFNLIHLCLLLLVPLLVLAARPMLQVRAQDQLCFTDGANGNQTCIGGRFREFWEQHGGVAVFGYPLAAETTAQTVDGTFVVQYFELARFEFHPENPAPFDVLLGRLGIERLQSLGVQWQTAPPDDVNPACEFVAQTSRNICGPFLDAYRDSARLGGLDPLVRWGLPLTAVQPITTPNGESVAQYFERARFERQPDGTISIARIGDEVFANTPPPAAPVPSDPPAPPAQPTPVPAEPTATSAPVEPTPTPAPAQPTPVPPPPPSVDFPQPPCNRNVPTPAEGLQLWMADPTPRGGTEAVACVRLIVNGEAARGANGVVYRGGARRPSIPQSTGYDGVASFIFLVQEGGTVPVEAIVTFRGVTYTAGTAYFPR